jgi:hypothetical protein
MRIGTVLTATDSNPLYLEFIPMFIRSWKILFPEVNIIIVLISDTIPSEIEECKEYIHLVKPIPNMHTAFQAQCIRLLYPATIDRTDGVIISDMDMVPLNRTYYEEPIKHLDDSAFISYRNLLLPYEIPMCYNIASPSTWKRVFSNDILEKWYEEVIYDGNHGGTGWNTDQIKLVQRYNEYTGLKYVLDDSARMNRLDREDILKKDIKYVKNQIQLRKYSDYHCLRPYSKYKTENDEIVETLKLPLIIQKPILPVKKFIWSLKK